MNDLISRAAAIAVADSSDYVGLSVDDVKKVTDEVVKGLKQLPSAQPEIIRCKDCEHNRLPATSGNADCEIFYGMNDQNGFCHKADRRTDDQT